MPASSPAVYAHQRYPLIRGSNDSPEVEPFVLFTTPKSEDFTLCRHIGLTLWEWGLPSPTMRVRDQKKLFNGSKKNYFPRIKKKLFTDQKKTICFPGSDSAEKACLRSFFLSVSLSSFLFLFCCLSFFLSFFVSAFFPYVLLSSFFLSCFLSVFLLWFLCFFFCCMRSFFLSLFLSFLLSFCQSLGTSTWFFLMPI